jgi:3-phenylpropionate/cinnamic acid dioxygenase small subunit
MTHDTFIENFENAHSINAKLTILHNLIDSNPTDQETLDLIKDYKGHLNDLIEEEAQAEDKQINLDIETGKYKLMRCTKTNLPFLENWVYRVRVDDMTTVYWDKRFDGARRVNPAVKDSMQMDLITK